MFAIDIKFYCAIFGMCTAKLEAIVREFQEKRVNKDDETTSLNKTIDYISFSKAAKIRSECCWKDCSHFQNRIQW